jgi:hypothetical protein
MSVYWEEVVSMVQFIVRPDPNSWRIAGGWVAVRQGRRD